MLESLYVKESGTNYLSKLARQIASCKRSIMLRVCSFAVSFYSDHGRNTTGIECLLCKQRQFCIVS